MYATHWPGIVTARFAELIRFSVISGKCWRINGFVHRVCHDVDLVGGRHVDPNRLKVIRSRLLPMPRMSRNCLGYDSRLPGEKAATDAAGDYGDVGMVFFHVSFNISRAKLR